MGTTEREAMLMLILTRISGSQMEKRISDSPLCAVRLEKMCGVRILNGVFS